MHPAKDGVCRRCSKIGHCAKVCRSVSHDWKVTSSALMLASTAAAGSRYATAPISLNRNISLEALIDSGSDDNCIKQSVAKFHKLSIIKLDSVISMASTVFSVYSREYCRVEIEFKLYSFVQHQFCRIYVRMLSLIFHLYSFVKASTFDFEVLSLPLIFVLYQSSKYSLQTSRFYLRILRINLRIKKFKNQLKNLFKNLTSDCHPIATKSRNYSQYDKIFIEN